MPKLNSGVLGAFSGKLDSVVGYRRLGKNIITGSKVYASINHIPSLVTNARKLEEFNRNYNRFQGILSKTFNQINQPERLNYEDLVRNNFLKFDYSNPFGYCVYSFPSLIHPLQFEVVDSCNPATRLLRVTMLNCIRWKIYGPTNQYRDINGNSNPGAIFLGFRNWTNQTASSGFSIAGQAFNIQFLGGVGMQDGNNQLTGHIVLTVGIRF